MCCAAVRILYPKSITWVNVYYSGDTDDDYDSDEDAVWLDPIAEIDLASFRDAKARAETERAARSSAKATPISAWKTTAASSRTPEGAEGCRRMSMPPAAQCCWVKLLHGGSGQELVLEDVAPNLLGGRDGEAGYETTLSASGKGVVAAAGDWIVKD